LIYSNEHIRVKEYNGKSYVVATVNAGTISNAIALPDAAVLRDSENQPFVYAETSANEFERRLVTLGQSVNGQTEITSGLKAGERVIGDGSLFLHLLRQSRTVRDGGPRRRRSAGVAEAALKQRAGPADVLHTSPNSFLMAHVAAARVLNEVVPKQAVTVTVRELQEQLRGLNAAAGKDFLALSESLQSTAGRTRQLAGLAREAATLASAGESDEAIGALQKILSNAAEMQILGEASRQKLHTILGQVQEAEVPLSRLVRLPKQLKTIGVLSRIEGSRLASTSENVSTLIAEIDDLAESIDHHVKAIAGEAQSVAGSASQGVRQLEIVEARERTQAQDLISRSKTVLDSFHERTERSRAAARKIDEQYASIQKAVEQIVISLQSEDIARQRVEHIQEALEQASASFGSGAAKEKCAGILVMQRSQLGSVRDLLAEALAKIHDNLRLQGARVGELAGETAALASDTDSEGNSFASGVKAELENLCSVLGPYLSSARSVLSIMEAVLPSVSKMTGAAEQVEDIQLSIRLMALNAEIRTVHLGEDGASMGVLASELHKITADSNIHTRAMLEKLKAIDDALQGMSKEETGATGAALLSFDCDSLRGQMRTLVGAVAQARHLVSAKLAALREMASSLGDEVSKAREIAARTKLIMQGFDAVIKGLDQALEGLGIRPRVAPSKKIVHETQNLHSLYSMEAERSVHHRVVGRDASGREVAAPAAGKQHEFGENVELF